MAYYDDEKNVEQYIEMARGFDGKFLIDILRPYLADGSSVLELGMGEGKDVLLLNEHFKVTGSDSSKVFLARFHAKHPKVDILELDAATLETDRRFDAIYSNKVLYHLTQEQLITSFKKQAVILKAGGIAIHSFWHGEGNEAMHGLHFEYYTEATLKATIGDEYDVIAVERYTESEKDDSLYIVLKKRVD